MENKKLEKIKFFFGIGRHSDYIKEYFDKSNIRSSLFVAVLALFIYSILLLAVTYGIFFVLCNKFMPATYATKVNLSIVFISILMSAINTYHQKLKEAQKDEKLEHAQGILLKLSISDEVTGIANMHFFRSQALEFMHDKKVDISSLIFLFLDIENFKILNEKYGFWEGNNFLKKFADMTNRIFADSIVAHFSNDNFVILTKNEAVEERLNTIRRNLLSMNYDIKLGLKVGSYRPENRECLPLIACDHARPRVRRKTQDRHVPA